MIRTIIRPAACALALKGSTALPAAAQEGVESAIDIQEVTSPGGIEAWLVEEHSLPFTALEIRFDGGAVLDPEGKEGATNLMMGLLEEGSGDMDARAFQTTREGLAAQFGFDAGTDTVSVSAQVLTENRGEAMDLLRQALIDPAFNETAVERVRAQVQAGIQADAVNPQRISGRTWFEEAYPGHPIGRPLSGTEESVASLSRADLHAAHEAAMVRDRIHVGAVGDITPEALGTLLDDLLGDLPQEGPALPEAADYALDGGTTVVDFPSPQSVALFGQPGIARDDDDFFAAYVLNHILGGGGFESRLMDEVREKRGLTYGISTFLSDTEYSELWLGSVASGNATIAEALEVTKAEWADIAENGVTEEELDQAKTYITGEYPLRFDGNGQIASILVGLQMIDLPPSYVLDRNSYIEAVTLEDVNRVAAELLDPEALHTVVVGQPEGLEGADHEAADLPSVLPEPPAAAPETGASQTTE
ncbi:M16 family metallopeptidase [Pseudoroseicyclus aestuarii]|uniref:Zinc protease n=1 Tax=Pseudoroseicyclus aestuarii TaxID=1795041 RepID=A0A318SSK3_9RHOB|nr:pitrilysin family protein [Pseudoroseicyclus aestuarii]PYE84683.1 zinc protease [Pseudoroseicyclus aestuarii]